MNITITDYKRNTVLIIPVVPPDLAIKSSSNNEVYNSIKQDINIIGNAGLREFSISSFFPVDKKYPFVASGSSDNGYEYVSFLEQNKNNKLPIRVVITGKNKKTILNCLMSIESFSFSVAKNSDLNYELSLKEFIDTL